MLRFLTTVRSGTILRMKPLKFPEASPIEPGGPDLPYFMLADDALKTWLTKPYFKKGMRRADMIVNYRISRGRRVVENAFGVLSSRFRVFHDVIMVLLDKVKDIVLACLVLHIMLGAERGASGRERDLEDEGSVGLWMVMGMTETPPTMPRNRGTT